MDYTRVSIFTEADNLELVASMLEDKGIIGIELQEPGVYSDFFNKRNSFDWDYISPSVEALQEVSSNITFYIEDTLVGIHLLDEILEDIRIVDIERVEVAGVSDEDWKYKWKEYFKPTKITERIVVKPSWETYEKIGDELVIEIDPGMAFGTGAHPTTTLCIRLLEKYIEGGRSTVLDIGCGSGILTIAAAMLGAKQVIGVEIDPEAVMVAKENIAANHLTGDVQVIQGDLTKDIDYRTDILAANLTADLIITLSKDAPCHLGKNGIFIVSGILTDKKDQVASALGASGFTVLDAPEEGEWCAMAATIERG